MGKQQPTFQCRACGVTTAKWAGRCEQCGEWAALEEQTAEPAAGGRGWSGGRAQRLGDVDAATAARLPTGLVEVDRVLGGGLVPGSVTLIGGEPGIGKSTLLLQLAAATALSGRRVLYVSGEEAPAQVRQRADRLRASFDGVWLVSETDLRRVEQAIADVRPALVVVDSIQTVASDASPGLPGSLSQVRDCGMALVQRAKASNVAMILVGHVTKEGTLAGPRTLEHLVDTVVSFEGERDQSLRILRGVKHRFGGTSEVGLFEMTATGLVTVTDPSGMYLADRRGDLPGSVVVPVLDGRRPTLVEVQALVVPVAPTAPAKRSAKGLDAGRLGIVIAVLTRLCGVRLGNTEIYAVVAGGGRATEPAVDLGVALAVVSSLAGVRLPPDLVVVGEVGLTGEIRSVPQLERRLQEAARMGFRQAMVPSTVLTGPVDLELRPVEDLDEALQLAHVDSSPTPW